MHNSHTAAASLSALLLLFRSPSSIFVGVNHTWLIAIQKHKDHNQDKTIYIQNTWVFNIHNLFLSFFAATIFLCASHCIASFRFGIIRLLCAHTMNAITLIIMCVVYFIYHFLLCIRRWLVSFFVSLSLNHCADRVINGRFFYYLSTNFFTNPPCFAAIIIHKRKIDDSKMVFFLGKFIICNLVYCLAMSMFEQHLFWLNSHDMVLFMVFSICTINMSHLPPILN